MLHKLTYLDALRALPLVDATTALRGRRLVVIAPHPDDESLGTGGLIAAAVASGHRVIVIFLTDGEGSHLGSPTFPPAAIGRLRRTEAVAALDALGLEGTSAEFLGLPDGELDRLSTPEAAVVIERLFGFMNAHTVVCVTAPTDEHPDHRIAHRWARIATAMARCELWTYPIWTWVHGGDTATLPAPQGWRIGIDAHLDAKRQAIAAHRSQHGMVVTDAQESFTLPAALLSAARQPFEVFVTTPA